MSWKALLHSIDYIYWQKEASYKVLKIAEFEAKLEFFKKNGTIAISKTNRNDWRLNTYKLEKKGYYSHLYTCEGNGNYCHYCTNNFDDSKNIYECRQKKEGTKCNQIEQAIFKELNGVSERVAFGYCDREAIYKCIPKQLYFINSKYKNMNIQHVSKVDYSSHYPDNLQGEMPDWNTKIQREGRVLPTKEYPFAYYIKSGMCAEYNRFDMHNWLNSKLVMNLFGERYTHVTDNEEITILCKKSEYTFDSTIKQLYEKKQKGELINGIEAKKVLNASIGFKHLSNIKSKRSRLDHIAAIVLGRANQQMIDIFDILGSSVLQIIVDGIIYKGTNKIGVDDKYLGALHQELLDCEFRMRGMNQYAFFKNGVCVNECHSGFNDNLKVEKLEDIDNWSKV